MKRNRNDIQGGCEKKSAVGVKDTLLEFISLVNEYLPDFVNYRAEKREEASPLRKIEELLALKLAVICQNEKLLSCRAHPCQLLEHLLRKIDGDVATMPRVVGAHVTTLGSTRHSDQSLWLVTHATPDRFPFIVEMASMWTAQVSVAVSNASVDQCRQLLKRCGGRIVVSHIPSLQTDNAMVSGLCTYEYCINMARNTAVRAALQATEGPAHLLLVDADFIPEASTTQRLRNLVSELHRPKQQQCNGKSARPRYYVIPAVDGTHGAFHRQFFPVGHRATQQHWACALRDQWESGTFPSTSMHDVCYSVEYQLKYEPFVFIPFVCLAEEQLWQAAFQVPGRRSTGKIRSGPIPWFTEAFTGYGLNKIEHMYRSVTHYRVELTVFPLCWLQARNHDKSRSWKNLYDPQGKGGALARLHPVLAPAGLRLVKRALWNCVQGRCAIGRDQEIRERLLQLRKRLILKRSSPGNNKVP